MLFQHLLHAPRFERPLILFILPLLIPCKLLLRCLALSLIGRHLPCLLLLARRLPGQFHRPQLLLRLSLLRRLQLPDIVLISGLQRPLLRIPALARLGRIVVDAFGLGAALGLGAAIILGLDQRPGHCTWLRIDLLCWRRGRDCLRLAQQDCRGRKKRQQADDKKSSSSPAHHESFAPKP